MRPPRPPLPRSAEKEFDPAPEVSRRSPSPTPFVGEGRGGGLGHHRPEKAGSVPRKRSASCPGAVLDPPSRAGLPPSRGNMENWKRWLKIGIMLVVAWFVLKIVFNVV